MKKIDIEQLKKIVGKGNVSDNIADLYVYGADASVHQAMPSAIVRPKTITEVQKIMRYANKNKVPVVPRGAGSGTSGHTVPIDGGIILDMKRMNHTKQSYGLHLIKQIQSLWKSNGKKLKAAGLFTLPECTSTRIYQSG